jgi:23S rRNA pseudouridine2605 synthase
MSDKLQKLLAHAGLGSRREIETWISDGRISVNGKRAKLGDRAAAADRILLDGRLLSLTEARDEGLKALIYHKPEGEICSRKDPKGRPSIFDNLPSIPRGRWVSVGRLDLNTSGLILLTNSGELANKLMHPSTGLEREYLVRIRGKASEQTITTLTGKGVMIDDRLARFDTVVPADMADEGTNHWYRVVIREGRYREVRRMWDEVGHTVSRLKRIRYGSIKLTRDVKRGQHRKIAPKQLEKLVVSLGLEALFTRQLYSNLRSNPSNQTRVAASRKTNPDRATGKRSNTHSKLGNSKSRSAHQSSPESSVRTRGKPSTRKFRNKAKQR